MVGAAAAPSAVPWAAAPSAPAVSIPVTGAPHVVVVVVLVLLRVVSGVVLGVLGVGSWSRLGVVLRFVVLGLVLVHLAHRPRLLFALLGQEGLLLAPRGRDPATALQLAESALLGGAEVLAVPVVAVGAGILNLNSN